MITTPIPAARLRTSRRRASIDALRLRIPPSCWMGPLSLLCSVSCDRAAIAPRSLRLSNAWVKPDIDDVDDCVGDDEKDRED
jgi:hypothetical protein